MGHNGDKLGLHAYPDGISVRECDPLKWQLFVKFNYVKPPGTIFLVQNYLNFADPSLIHFQGPTMWQFILGVGLLGQLIWFRASSAFVYPSL